MESLLIEPPDIKSDFIVWDSIVLDSNTIKVLYKQNSILLNRSFILNLVFKLGLYIIFISLFIFIITLVINFLTSTSK